MDADEQKLDWIQRLYEGYYNTDQDAEVFADKGNDEDFVGEIYLYSGSTNRIQNNFGNLENGATIRIETSNSNQIINNTVVGIEVYYS